jgi:transcriptional regulator with XRE-family HTH domain
MQIAINSVADLGLVVRSVRRSSKVRLDDLAATTGVSKQFATDVEYGKPTVRLGLVLKMLSELGIPLTLDIPQDAEQELAALRLKGSLRPSKRRVRAVAGRKSHGKSSGSRDADD